MEILTPEQIANATEDLEGQANIAGINKLYREQDESHLWPINNSFNVTERAIRRARKFKAETGPSYGLEYAYIIDSMLSDIVNDENNW